MQQPNNLLPTQPRPKRCTMCHNTYPLTKDHFYKKGKYFTSSCKRCLNEKQVQIWRNTHDVSDQSWKVENMFRSMPEEKKAEIRRLRNMNISKRAIAKLFDLPYPKLSTFFRKGYVL